jgi:hypothetical protein
MKTLVLAAAVVVLAHLTVPGPGGAKTDDGVVTVQAALNQPERGSSRLHDAGIGEPDGESCCGGKECCGVPRSESDAAAKPAKAARPCCCRPVQSATLSAQAALTTPAPLKECVPANCTNRCRNGCPYKSTCMGKNDCECWDVLKRAENRGRQLEK